jgi:hypothetical protein
LKTVWKHKKEIKIVDGHWVVHSGAELKFLLMYILPTIKHANEIGPFQIVLKKLDG